MKILIKAHHLELNRETITSMDRRLRFAFGRFSLSNKKVTVRLTDFSVSKGTIDKGCLIFVSLRKGGEVIA